MANHCWPMAEMEGFEPPDGLTRQLISSQPRYDHFDTSPRCIFKALRVSVRLRAECRNRRTKRRKTVDIQLLKSVDNPEKPEISRVFGDGSSTDLPHFECGPFSHLGTSPDANLYYYIRYPEKGQSFLKLFFFVLLTNLPDYNMIMR